MVKLKQFLLSLLVLSSLAIIEADPDLKALRTEWKAWKKLHGKILNYTFLQFLLTYSILCIAFRKELQFREGGQNAIEGLHEEFNLHCQSQ